MNQNRIFIMNEQMSCVLCVSSINIVYFIDKCKRSISPRRSYKKHKKYHPNVSLKKIPREIKDLATIVGISFIEDPVQTVAYSENRLNICLSRNLATILHDIAHYQMASPSRRFCPDFGLGNSPDTRGIRVPKKILDASREECFASVLGILYEAIYHVRPYFTYHVNSHDDDEEFSKTVYWLVVMGFIELDESGYFRPTGKINMEEDCTSEGDAARIPKGDVDIVGTPKNMSWVNKYTVGYMLTDPKFDS